MDALSAVGMGSGAIVSFAVAVSFAAGLNLYATTATLGVLSRLGWVTLPTGLAPLGHTWVIVAGLVLFACEMLADKIPFVDLVWNFAHTFIRVPVAALLAWRASSQLSPGMQAMVVVVSAGVALIAHGGKTAARTAVTASPEPFSNAILSAGEDMLSIAVTWIATKHPFTAAIVVAFLVVGAVIGARWVWRRVGTEWLRMKGRSREEWLAPVRRAIG